MILYNDFVIWGNGSSHDKFEPANTAGLHTFMEATHVILSFILKLWIRLKLFSEYKYTYISSTNIKYKFSLFY